MLGCLLKAQNESLIIPLLRFAHLTSQEQGVHGFSSVAVPPKTSRQHAPFSPRQPLNRSVLGNPQSSLVIFTLAIGDVVDIHIETAEKMQRGFSLGVRPN
jgi:hypothetical protein